MLKYGNRLLIIDGRDPFQYVDLATKKLYKYPASADGYIDESSEWPIYKWWRNPIDWYRWRKISKIAERNTKFILQTTEPGPNPFWKKSDLE